jgi:hypothetical protein
MTKSHVGMGYHVCPVCLKEHDPVVLLDRRLRNSLTDHEFAGWKLCEEHQAKFNEGYIALIECENRPTSMADAKRTGNIAFIRTEAWPDIFNVPAPLGGLCFVENGTIADLQKRVGADYGTD